MNSINPHLTNIPVKIIFSSGTRNIDEAMSTTKPLDKTGGIILVEDTINKVPFGN